jgi:hypothetical protein
LIGMMAHLLDGSRVKFLSGGCRKLEHLSKEMPGQRRRGPIRKAIVSSW